MNSAMLLYREYCFVIDTTEMRFNKVMVGIDSVSKAIFAYTISKLDESIVFTYWSLSSFPILIPLFVRVFGDSVDPVDV